MEEKHLISTAAPETRNSKPETRNPKPEILCPKHYGLVTVHETLYPKRFGLKRKHAGVQSTWTVREPGLGGGEEESVGWNIERALPRS